MTPSVTPESRGPAETPLSRWVDSLIVSPIGLHGDMDTLELRTEADAILAELVGAPGGSARLREDQWQAVAALVEERRRALVVQRTGWGKSAVYFVATALLRRRGSRPDGDHFAAVGTDAQPGRVGGTGGHPGPHDQLGQS